VLIGMCLLGLFIALGTWVLSWSNDVQKELQVHVYFQSSATPQQEHAVRLSSGTTGRWSRSTSSRSSRRTRR